MKVSICPSCQSRKVRKVVGPVDVHLKQLTITVPDIEHFFCEKCGERATDVENEKKIDAYLARRGKKAA